MKMMAVICVLAFSSVGFSQVPDVPADQNVAFESWCAGDKVMTLDQDGIQYVQWDCYDMTDAGLCVENTSKKNDTTIVTATCN